MNLRSFLDWFEGYAENIDKAPTPKQWNRIVDKVKALQAASGDAAPVAALTNGSAPVGGEATTARFKAEVLRILQDNDILNLDEEDAQAELRKTPIGMDALNTPPEEFAGQILARLMP